MSAKRLIMDQVAVTGDPIYSPYGYVIGEDGTTYSLTQQWTHGVILALLYPEAAKEHGIGVPDEEYNVFAYQQFELDRHGSFPVIRVSFGMVTDFAISKGEAAATPKQLQALSRIFRLQEKGLNETVQTDFREMSAREALKVLAKTEKEIDEDDCY